MNRDPPRGSFTGSSVGLIVASAGRWGCALERVACDPAPAPGVQQDLHQPRQFGGLGMVIANAGADEGGNIGEGRFEAHRAVVDVNLLGAMATIDAAVAHFRSKGGGQVVGFTSVAAAAGLPGGAPYCASKAGLTRYLQSLRGELWNSGITVTTVAPGYIDTPINESLGDKRPFLIDTRTGARKIMDRIESGAVHATVPRVPWAVVEYLLARIPTRLLRKVHA
ncbi:SDR family NAD(P)-dependent oxidoreductase [Streptomyces sp. R28]|uniref:SDR family NAD(P)-dependent oxidoreductase n=1 Tax=Streptomyces sp. R28 TaxID=3238628 RepID=A0AB39QAG8_9ACTN